MVFYHSSFSFFFFNDTATTEIYTLSLHDALPICVVCMLLVQRLVRDRQIEEDLSPSKAFQRPEVNIQDRKSTRLNSSHTVISYAVFCLKKKKKHIQKCASKRQHDIDQFIVT